MSYQPPAGYQPQPPPRKRHRVRNTLLSVAGVLVVLIAISAALGGGSKPASNNQAASQPPPTATPQATPSPTATLTQAQLRKQTRITRQAEAKASASVAAAVKAADQAAARKAARARRARALANSIQYIVTGTPGADVTYGPTGSDYQGSSPMYVTARIGNPEYYAIDAQLNGGGQVTCEIKVAGKVISRATAAGGYNIASCEISQGFLGGWQNDNGG